MLKKSSKYEAGDWVVDKFTGERGMVLIARPSDLTDCMVVQLNPVTKDGKAGVQFGELVRVTKTGFESLHRTPHELFRAGQMI